MGMIARGPSPVVVKSVPVQTTPLVTLPLDWAAGIDHAQMPDVAGACVRVVPTIGASFLSQARDDIRKVKAALLASGAIRVVVDTPTIVRDESPREARERVTDQSVRAAVMAWVKRHPMPDGGAEALAEVLREEGV